MKPIDTLQTLVESLHERLKLRWLIEPPTHRLPLKDPSDAIRQRPVGSMNCVRPSRIQIVGRDEFGYLNELHPATRTDMMARVFSASPAAIIFAEELEPDPELRALAEKAGIPLLGSSLHEQEITDHLQHVLTHALAERTTLHGVFLDVLGMGVLLVGDAGIGKSELALELVARGHRLIADDAPEFAKVAPELIEGRCPPLLQDFLEVRGLGVLNIRAMFGESSVRENDHLHLIVNMRVFDPVELANMDRLRGSLSSRSVLGVEIPEITIPVAPGRDLAVLLETAVRNQILRTRGYDAGQDLADRQATELARDDDSHVHSGVTRPWN